MAGLNDIFSCMFPIRRVLVLLLVLLVFTGCGIYNFQGGKLNPGLDTVSVELFENKSSIIVPTMAQDITEKLKDRFNGQSNLELVTYDGDLAFSGEIKRYDVAPVAISGNETASQNRLTVTVGVVYTCAKYPEEGWTSNFSQFSDFPTTSNLSDVEDGLIDDILDRLTQDIFNKVLSNW